jgi:hypothetical protein
VTFTEPVRVGAATARFDLDRQRRADELNLQDRDVVITPQGLGHSCRLFGRHARRAGIGPLGVKQVVELGKVRDVEDAAVVSGKDSNLRGKP